MPERAVAARLRTAMTPVLEHLLVRDVAHKGILHCSAEAGLDEVAQVMSSHRLHAVVISAGEDGRPEGLVSDLDVVQALNAGNISTAGQVAATEPVIVSANERLLRAAQLMVEHAVSHLVVLDADSGRPVGILSTLDIADVLASTRPEDAV